MQVELNIMILKGFHRLRMRTHFLFLKTVLTTEATTTATSKIPVINDCIVMTSTLRGCMTSTGVPSGGVPSESMITNTPSVMYYTATLPGHTTDELTNEANR